MVEINRHDIYTAYLRPILRYVGLAFPLLFAIAYEQSLRWRLIPMNDERLSWRWANMFRPR